MDRYISTVQKRIGLLISIIGILVVINNIIDRSRSGDLIYIFYSISVAFVFACTVPFIISIFVESPILKALQVLTFIAMGTANIMQSYQEFYGPAMFLAAWLVMRNYGFLDKHAKIKNTLMILFIAVLSQISARIHQPQKIFAGLNTLYYALFLIILILIIWRDTLKQQEFLKKENLSLQTNYKKMAAQIAELEEGRKPYDLKAVKISPAEERVIEALTVYKASNREIAERLNIAESTVKLHLYNIFNKIGVDNRFTIIDLCKYNFK